MAARRSPAVVKPLATFDINTFLESRGVSRRVMRFARGGVVFAQGAPANSVFYLHEGSVRLSVLSPAGKEAVVAMMKPGDFFGEGSLAGQVLRVGTATAMAPTNVLRIPKREMQKALHREAAVSDLFIAHMLARNIRIEEDLIDQLFNTSEKRLARALLLLAQHGQSPSAVFEAPRVSQEVLAEMVGTTRARVNFFMNKFRKLGLIEYNGGLKVNSSLLSVILHD